MKDDKFYLQAYEYIFSLGRKTSLIAQEVLPPESVCYQSVQIAAFDPVYLISVLRIGTMAELEFCAEVSCTNSREEFNAKIQWIAGIEKALERETVLPTELPAYFCFAAARGALTQTQINWLKAQMEQLQPLTIHSEDTFIDIYARDGHCSSGSVKVGDREAHDFYQRNVEPEDLRQRAYHETLYRLAASVIEDTQCLQIMKNMRFNSLYPPRTPVAEFTFPLID